SDTIPFEQTASTEAFADVRFRGQSYELTVPVLRPSTDHVREQFLQAYTAQYGRAPDNREIEIVTLRFRRYGRGATVTLPPVQATAAEPRAIALTDLSGTQVQALCVDRGG